LEFPHDRLGRQAAGDRQQAAGNRNAGRMASIEIDHGTDQIKSPKAIITLIIFVLASKDILTSNASQ
jgi:hypothetical protein